MTNLRSHDCEVLAHGWIDIKLPSRTIRVYGGSFAYGHLIQDGTYKVNLEAQIDNEANFTIDVPDFGAPDELSIKNLARNIMVSDKTVYYVGCLGGFGRTGTVIAALLIIFCRYDAVSSVTFVRRSIHQNCIESLAQTKFLCKLHQDRKGRSLESYFND
ncbi:tyrosine phosphatase [Vibrio phage vB_VhaS-VHB1]|nr:tyrosine phosphatase [Vibrio phage vB_VhaS-VHB1]